MKKRLLIIGAGGHGKVVADIAVKMYKWQNIVFLDEDDSKKAALGFAVIGKPSDAVNYMEEYDVFIAVGDNAMRENIQEKLKSEGASIPVLIHPDAVIGKEVELGIGTVVMAGVVINCCTHIGNGCIINSGSLIDHDNVIEDYVHVSPGANLAGTVKVGKGSWLGVGSVISNNINIMRECRVGAGAVVLKDITEPGVYVGVPARSIEK